MHVSLEEELEQGMGGCWRWINLEAQGPPKSGEVWEVYDDWLNVVLVADATGHWRCAC